MKKFLAEYTGQLIRLLSRWKWPIGVFLTARLLTWGIGAALWLSGIAPRSSGLLFGVTPPTQDPLSFLVGIWYRWDAIHNYKIALSGYSQSYLSAFFPLYPLTSAALSLVTGMDRFAALLLAGNAAFLALLILFYEAARDLLDENDARTAVLFLAFTPNAFFYLAPYPQALVVLLTVAAWYALRKRRWGLAGIAAFLVGLSHPSIVPVAVLLGLELLRQWQSSAPSGPFWTWIPWKQRTILALTIPLLPFAGLGSFLLWRTLQGFPSFTAMNAEIWGRVFIFPWQGVAEFIKMVGIMNWRVVVNDLPAILLAVIALVAAIRRQPYPLWLYQLTLLGFVFSTTMATEPLGSSGRFLLLAFPTALALPGLLTNRFLRLAVLAVILTLYCLLCALYVCWVWVG
jgi:hypothetical protein